MRTISDETQREYTLVKTLEVMVLLLIILSSTANASDNVISAGLKSIEVSSSPNPSNIGQPITITATINIGYEDEAGEMHIIPAPGGTVDFLAGQNCFVHAEVHNGVATATTSYSEYWEYSSDWVEPGVCRIGVDYHWDGVIDDCNVWIHGPETFFTHTFLANTPTIIWSNPADIIYGTSLSITQLNAIALYNGYEIPGNFVYTPPSGTVLSEGEHTLHVDFIPDFADYEIVSKDVTIKVLTPAEDNNNIPEFPSVAIPAVAFLGVLLIFSKKKSD